MADLEVRITGLPVAASLAESDSVVVDRASGTGRATLAEVAAVIGAGGGLKKAARVAASYTAAADLTAGATVNGVLLAAGDRVLVPIVETGAGAGIYVVQATGDAVRASDMDSSADVEHGALVWVREGDVHAESLWALVTAAPITLGTTEISFGRIDMSPAERLLLVEHDGRIATLESDTAGAVTDGDFSGSDAGTLTRTGAGTYAVRKDNLAAGGVPTTGDDAADGYSVGSLWVTGAAIYMCRDATTGFAEWVRVRALSTATPEPIAAAGSAGASADVSPANHVHAHGTQTDPAMHAVATPTTAGFASAEHADLLYERTKAGDHFADFFNVLGGAEGYQSSVSGTGATLTNPATPPVQPHFGVVYLGTGTTTTGRSAISSTRVVGMPSNGPIRFATRLLVPALADVSEDFEVAAGFSNTTVSPDAGVGVWFAYDRVGVGGNWRARTNRTSTATDTDTGVAVTTGWVVLAIDFDRTAGEARFYINGTLVATITTTLPNTTDGMTPVLGIFKSAGTTDRGVHVDWVHVLATITGGR